MNGTFGTPFVRLVRRAQKSITTFQTRSRWLRGSMFLYAKLTSSKLLALLKVSMLFHL